ncbi:MAG: PilN domain-containing protein [Thermoanaerobaculia bacterium]|nr:PilN domain-containing protein [Thermoanaerobaculia bacterium]
MIRINLLSEGRRPVVARSAKPKMGFGDQDPSLIILCIGAAVGLLVAGGWWWQLNSEVKSWRSKISTAQAELQELDEYVKKVEAFKAKQAELTTKIEVITNLTANQRGPVHVMDEVSKALPDLLWLSEMGIKGSEVTLRGSAFNTNAVAQFIENLVNVEWFAEPESGPISRDSGTLYQFQLGFKFSTAKLLELQGVEPVVEADVEDDEL